ncbi:MAG: hypothetical protein H0W90_10120 [Actinobacteria bacterium]|nr:hypothetical protein [Actinomycetota bacterium]
MPKRILRKPAALAEDEFAIIKRHPDWGLKLLRELGSFNASTQELVHSHHERSTGRGIRVVSTQARSRSSRRVSTAKRGATRQLSTSCARKQTLPSTSAAWIALESVLAGEQLQPDATAFRLAAALA